MLFVLPIYNYGGPFTYSIFFSANVLGMMPGIKAENWPLGLSNHYTYGYDPTSSLTSASAVAANALSSTH